MSASGQRNEGRAARPSFATGLMRRVSSTVWLAVVVAAEAFAVIAPHHDVHWILRVALVLVAGIGVVVLARREDLTMRAVVLAMFLA